MESNLYFSLNHPIRDAWSFYRLGQVVGYDSNLLYKDTALTYSERHCSYLFYRDMTLTYSKKTWLLLTLRGTVSTYSESQGFNLL